jgi:peptidoglycan/xylan/chitin deacetylase (PgdA/CDA1 family)
MTAMERKTRKIFIGIVVGFFSAFFLAAIILGVITYFDYQEIYANQQLLLGAQKDYETPNFNDSKYNYIAVPESTNIKPGQVVEFEVFYKNTGVLSAENLNLGISIPENVTLDETSIKGLSYKIKYGSAIFDIGNVQPESSGSIKISFIVKSPLDNGVKVTVPVVRLRYAKASPLIGKKENFNYDFSSPEELVVASAPDFTKSKIFIEGVSEGKINNLSFGGQVSYRINIENSGNMDAAGVNATFKGLENLVILQEENSDFKVSGSEVTLDLEKLPAGDSKSYILNATVNKSTENNTSIMPEMEIAYLDKIEKFSATESIVRLFPSFEKSSISIAARGGGGNYSGDVVDVTVTVKNTGEIEGNNIIVDLVLSNLFTLEQGEAAWKVAKLAIGENATFKASLKIIEGVVKDTYASCSLKISSDETDAIGTGNSKILVSGEKPFTRNVIPIVALHGIEPGPYGAYELGTAEFDYLCGTLKALGYKTITLLEMLSYLDSGKKLPEKPVILTSDDGYYSIYAYALPILKKYNYRMTVFLATGLIGNTNEDRHLNEFDLGKPGIPERPMLIWPEVAAMAKYGIEFQSHTVSHEHLADLSSDEVYFELAQSKADIEGHLKRPCVFIAWPFDNYSNSMIPLLPKIGYRGALRYGGGIENVSGINIYAIKRIQIYSYTRPSDYGALMGLS